MRESLFNAGCFLVGQAGRVLGYQLSRPVFIVGTGRCGTSLLVRMLRSHRGMAGFPGEANELWHPALEPFETTRLPTPPIEADPASFTGVSLAHWPNNQGERIRSVFRGFNLMRGPSRSFFTKSAMISFMIPTILQLFPDARILHIYRFGPAVVKSYVKKNFGKYSRFAFEEGEYRRMCARYWNHCILRISEDSRDLRGDQFLEFSYEDLCRTPTGMLSTIALFLGIPFEGFGFDIAKVANQDPRAESGQLDPASAELRRLMSPGLTLKGYSTIA